MQTSSHIKNDPYVLLRGTLDVINQTLEEHQDSKVFSAIAPLIDKLVAGRECGVAVYKTYADRPFDYFTVRLEHGKLELARRDEPTGDVAWNVSQDYLQQVCERPKTFIDNPARLYVEFGKNGSEATPPFSGALQAYSQTQRHCPRIKGS